jgi:hypothetical protein
MSNSCMMTLNFKQIINVSFHPIVLCNQAGGATSWQKGPQARVMAAGLSCTRYAMALRSMTPPTGLPWSCREPQTASLGCCTLCGKPIPLRRERLLPELYTFTFRRPSQLGLHTYHAKK